MKSRAFAVFGFLIISITSGFGDSHSADGVALRTQKGLRLVYHVEIEIDAAVEAVWTLLEDVNRWTDWNSTIVSLEGSIEDRGRVILVSKVDPSRTFKMRVRNVDTNLGMEWIDGVPGFFRGIRTYKTVPIGDSATRFAMTEELKGIMVPMAAGSMPDFRPSFEAFAADIKRAAERE